MDHKKLTKASIAVGFLGVLALLGAWADVGVFGWSQQHLFADAVVLLLIAIWLKLGAIYHKG